MILLCTCQHPFQDKLYGKQRRVMNPCKPKLLPQNHYYRCSVCLREINTSQRITTAPESDAIP